MEIVPFKVEAQKILAGIDAIGKIDDDTMIDVPKKQWSTVIAYVRYLEAKACAGDEAADLRKRVAKLTSAIDDIADIVTGACLGELDNEFENPEKPNAKTEPN